SASFWFTICPHELAAGDQMTGLGPSVASSQFEYSNCAAAPDDFFCGRTKMQSLPSLASGDLLNDLARSVMRSIFSGDTDMSTTTQSPGSPRSAPDFGFASVHAAPRRRAVKAIAEAVLAATRLVRGLVHLTGSSFRKSG